MSPSTSSTRQAAVAAANIPWSAISRLLRQPRGAVSPQWRGLAPSNAPATPQLPAPPPRSWSSPAEVPTASWGAPALPGTLQWQLEGLEKLRNKEEPQFLDLFDAAIDDVRTEAAAAAAVSSELPQTPVPAEPHPTKQASPAPSSDAWAEEYMRLRQELVSTQQDLSVARQQLGAAEQGLTATQQQLAAADLRAEKQAQEQQAALAKAKRRAHQREQAAQQWQTAARQAEQEAQEWQVAAEEQAERADKAEQSLAAAEATMEVASLWMRQQAVAAQQAEERQHAKDLAALRAEHAAHLGAEQHEHAARNQYHGMQIALLQARLAAALQQLEAAGVARRADKSRQLRQPGWLRRLVASCAGSRGGAAVRDP
ncbi:hypothetical protein ABPG75_010036 [Micractinium tetrahymenae]